MKEDKQNLERSNSLFESEENNDYTEFIEKLYRDNYKTFYKIAYSRLKNKADAEDAVTESFIKFYKHKDKISKMKCPEITSYLVSIVKNLSIDMKKAQGKIIFSEFSNELIDSVAFSESADDVLFKMLKIQKLYELLDILNETEYDIFECRVIDKSTFKEIAIKIGISEEAAKKRYQRLIKKLREKDERRVN